MHVLRAVSFSNPMPALQVSPTGDRWRRCRFSLSARLLFTKLSTAIYPSDPMIISFSTRSPAVNRRRRRSVPTTDSASQASAEFKCKALLVSVLALQRANDHPTYLRL